MKNILFVLLFIIINAQVSSVQNNEFEVILETVVKSYENVKDYSCNFNKKQWVYNKYIISRNIEYMHLKPDYYYMKWTEGDDKGMEVIYAGKKYDKKLRLSIPGLKGLFIKSLDPYGKFAMTGNRHSMLESDIGYMINILVRDYHLAKQKKIGKFKILGTKIVDKKETTLLEANFSKNEYFYAEKIYIYVCEKLKLPLKISIYETVERLTESYEFTNFKINNGFTDFDFDIENKAYNFD